MVTKDRSQPTYVGSTRSMTPGKTYYYVDMGRRDRLNAGCSYPFVDPDHARAFLESVRARDVADGFPDREYEINIHVHVPTGL